MLLLKDDDVQKILTMPMTLEVLEETQREIIRDDAATMGRIDVYLPCERPESYYRWALMTGGARRDGFVVARMLSDIVAGRGRRRGAGRDGDPVCRRLYRGPQRSEATGDRARDTDRMVHAVNSASSAPRR